jgi:hypothetical protein
VHVEASTKPRVYKKIEIFWTNIASTMACPNLKNWPKNGLHRKTHHLFGVTAHRFTATS